MAHIAVTCYDLETGGIARVAAYLAKGFADTGHRVSLILCSDRGLLHTQLTAQMGGGVSVVTLGDKAFSKRVLGQIGTFRAMRKWLKREMPDVVLSASNNISWFTGLACIGLGTAAPKLFVKTTNPILRKTDGPVLTALRQAGYARLFGAASAVLTLSEAESRMLEAQFPHQRGQFRAVFNPYLTDAFTARARARQAAARPLTLLGVGRLVEQKNFARAIRAFARAQELARHNGLLAWETARMIIAGEGPQHGELQRLIDSLDMGSSITLAGFANDVPSLLREADRFVLSSNYEGLPAVVIEALGSGCAVISTDCFPAARETLEGLHGCRVCAEDDDALAQAMLASVEEEADSGKLRDRAMDYSVASAIASHLSAMGL